MNQVSIFESEEPRRCLLISLKPEYFKWMVEGYKRFEYRSRFPNCKTYAFIYVTKPVGEILACIEFDEPIKNPDGLIGHIGQGVDDFVAGKKGNKKAIPITRIHLLSEAVDLRTMRSYGITAPQSFCYLKMHDPFLAFLKERVSNAAECE